MKLLLNRHGRFTTAVFKAARNPSWMFRWSTLLFFFTAILFIVNAFHETYPDEFDNILGGWYLLHGKLLYSGYFTHHGPIPYVIGALVTLFSGQSFVHFRVFYAIFLLGVVFGTYFLLRRRVGVRETNFFLLFMVFLGIESTYYWAHMLLADNVAAFSFLPAFGLLLLNTFHKRKIQLKDVGIISVLSAIGLYSSLTYTYLYVIIFVSTLYLYYKHTYNRKLFSVKQIVYPLVLFVVPHLLFFLYLLVTGSLSDYLYQNFTFNTSYYIYNYPRPEGSTHINPIRYAVVIANDFVNNYYTLLIGIKSFDFVFPVNATMAVSNAAFFIYTLVRKRYKMAVFFLAVLIYTNVRSNPLTSKETDYQSAVYVIFSFFTLFFFLTELYRSLNLTQKFGKKAIYTALLLIVGIYAFFANFFFILKFVHKFYPKYMGSAPLIYDRPQIAPIINAVTTKDDYVWIGPFEFEDLFYTNAKVPTKYHVLIGGIGKSEKLRQNMLTQLNQNKPKVIYFDKNFVYLFQPAHTYSKFFMDFLKENYVTLYGYKVNNVRYSSVAPIHVSEKMDIETKLYIRKDVVDGVIQKLLEKNYIKQTTT